MTRLFFVTVRPGPVAQNRVFPYWQDVLLVRAPRYTCFNNMSFRKLRGLGNQEGSAAVEFAISLPFLILLAIGVADFGRLYIVALATASAARAGAQYGAQLPGTTGDAAGIEQAARADAGNIGLQSVTSTQICKCSDGTTPACTGTCAGYGVPQVFVRVSTTNTVSFAFRYPGLAQSVPVVRTVTLRVQ